MAAAQPLAAAALAPLAHAVATAASSSWRPPLPSLATASSALPLLRSLASSALALAPAPPHGHGGRPLAPLTPLRPFSLYRWYDSPWLPALAVLLIGLNHSTQPRTAFFAFGILIVLLTQFYMWPIVMIILLLFESQLGLGKITSALLELTTVPLAVLGCIFQPGRWGSCEAPLRRKVFGLPMWMAALAVLFANAFEPQPFRPSSPLAGTWGLFALGTMLRALDSSKQQEVARTAATGLAHDHSVSLAASADAEDADGAFAGLFAQPAAPAPIAQPAAPVPTEMSTSGPPAPAARDSSTSGVANATTFSSSGSSGGSR